MLTDSATVLGLSDGGAHCSSIVDAGVTADFFGLRDRGRLAPGLRTDVNVIDFDAMRLHIPEVHYDLPAGGRRLMQRVDGYVVTFVAGTSVFERGTYTGATPGKLVRASA